MPFDGQLFEMTFSASKKGELLFEAGNRLQNLNPASFSRSDLLNLVGNESIRRQVQTSSSQLAASQHADALAEEGQLDDIDQGISEMASVGRANLAVSIAQTAILAGGMLALHRAIKEQTEATHASTEQLRRLELLSREQITVQTQQLQVQQEVLKALQQSRRVEAEQLYQQGEKLLKAGYPEEALKRYTMALDYDATDLQVMLALAIAYSKSATPERAEEWLVKAASLARAGSEHLLPMIVRNHARYLLASGRPSEAVVALKSIEKSWVMTDRYELAVCLALTGNLVGAREQLAAVLTADIQMVVVASTDPRLQGKARQAFDLWVAVAHQQYLDWCARNLAAISETGKLLQKGGAPISLVELADAASAECQTLMGEAAFLERAAWTRTLSRTAAAIATEQKTAKEEVLAATQKALALADTTPASASAAMRQFHEVAQTHGLAITWSPKDASLNTSLNLGLIAGSVVSSAVAGVLGGIAWGMEVAFLAFGVSFLTLLVGSTRAHNKRLTEFKALLEAIRHGSHAPRWWRLELKTAGVFTVSL